MPCSQAEVHHAANDKGAQIVVAVPGRRDERGEDVHRPARERIGHRGHGEQCFDRAIPELPPHLRVFLSDHLLRRTRRPGDADAAQVVEADLDAAIDPVRSQEELHPQLGNVGQVGEADCATCKISEARLRRRQMRR